MTIPVVAIVGAAFSGRDSFLVAARHMLERHGYEVFVQLGTAIELMTSGDTPGRVGGTEFQSDVLESSMFHEDKLLQRALSLQEQEPARKFALLCIGGVLDAAAYVDEESFASLLISYDRDDRPLQALRGRYSHVVFLETPAMTFDAEAFAQFGSVVERHAEWKKARDAHLRLSTVWHNHDSLELFSYQPNFGRKMEHALAWLAKRFGLAGESGIERTFRIDSFSEALLPEKGVVKILSRKDFLLSYGVAEESIIRRVVRDDEYYVRCEQVQESGRYAEKRNIISQPDYQAEFWKHRDTTLWEVEKVGFIFTQDGKLWEVDTYGAQRSGLILLRTKADVDEEISLPCGLGGREVTGEVRYTNRALADPGNELPE